MNVETKLQQALELTQRWALNETVPFLWPDNEPQLKQPRPKDIINHYRKHPDKLMNKIIGAKRNVEFASQNLYKLQAIWEKILIED